MIWDDTGYLIYKNRYNENSLISEIYTQNHGKISGIIFGGTSKKIKNYLQLGNKLHVNYNSKNENRIGYFKLEINQALSPLYFDNQKKLSCISSAMNLIKMLTAESQSNKSVYDLIENFYEILKSRNWIKNYIYWELELFKCLGYDLQFKDLVEKKIIENQLRYVSKSKTDQKIIPDFLINKSENIDDLKSLLIGLRLVGDYLEKTILKPNNLTQPLSRLQFINTLK
ncbi:DNA repair protein RecO [Candidatus Pelagibacter sp.]|nr:DNA repair protein RecO [Candidatus Pelagibacter sp.]